MSQQSESAALESLFLIEEQIRCRLAGRVRAFQLVAHPDGLILRGGARTYYAKQLAQQAVMEMTRTPILANEIEVL